jgi:hypothetical protein
MTRFAASMILVALSSTSALAQDEPVSPAPAQQTAPQTADADAPSESHIAAAIDFLKAIHSDVNIQAMLDVVIPLAMQQAKRAQPNLSDAAAAMILQRFREAITARQDEMMRLQATEYARHFSEQELHDLAAFYRSPVGQKYVTSIPTLLKETSPIMQRWIAGVVQQVLQDLQHSLPPSQNSKS